MSAPKTESVKTERTRRPERAADAAAEGTDESGTRRRRRRRNSTTPVSSTFTEGAAESTSGEGQSAPAADRGAEGAGTHDGAGKEHHDGKPAPARRRRRRRGGSGAGAAPVTGA